MANTPYDDVFRTLVNDCRSLLIPYVNEMFGENFTGDEEIRFNPNEQFMVQQDGKEEKRVTDTWFTICGRQKKTVPSGMSERRRSYDAHSHVRVRYSDCIGRVPSQG